MMKTTIIKNIGCGLLLLGTTACADYLDKESFDIITPEQVWQDPKLINGVMVNLYDGLNLEDFNYWYRDAWRLQNASSMSDEAQGSFQKDPLFDNGNATYTYEDALFEQKFSDRYKNIRNCNDFIYQLQEATALSDSEKKLLLAESRFLRAMHYFTLVKRYGGVPLIDEPQQYDPNNLEALMVPRNKEVEIYDFIVKLQNAKKPHKIFPKQERQKPNTEQIDMLHYLYVHELLCMPVPLPATERSSKKDL